MKTALSTQLIKPNSPPTQHHGFFRTPLEINPFMLFWVLISNILNYRLLIPTENGHFFNIRLENREFWQPRRQWQPERTKNRYDERKQCLCMRVLHLIHFVAVPCKTTTSNNKIIGFVENVNTRQSIFLSLLPS